MNNLQSLQKKSSQKINKYRCSYIYKLERKKLLTGEERCKVVMTYFALCCRQMGCVYQGMTGNRKGGEE